jgi:4-hydroxy-tetrahydrodipicolinate synthase
MSTTVKAGVNRSSPISRGVWPVMLTPFTGAGAIDWQTLDLLTDWYIGAGVAGLFAVCLSSEMYDLTDVERLAVSRRVMARSTGRVPVVASGTFGGPIDHQARMVRQVADTGVDAVVVIVNQLAAAEETDSVWQSRAEALMEATGEIPLGLYECPMPYKRLLSPELLGWAASTGRFVFHKDTSCAMASIRAKLLAVRGAPFRWLNANCPTLLESLQAGGDGYCGIAANFMPQLYVWMCANYDTQPETARRLQRFLSIADPVVRFKYPAAAKRFLAQAGVLASPYCRIGNPDFTEEDLIILRDLQESIAEWRLALG